MALQSGINLEPGENLVVEIEAELWAQSTNPIAQLFGAIQRFFAAICGFKKKAFLVITDKRVIEVATIIQWYCITTGREVTYVLPSAVAEVGYNKKTTCGVFCPVYHLYYKQIAGLVSSTYQLKGATEETAKKTIDAFYAAIANK
jgi:hypothetical protein